MAVGTCWKREGTDAYFYSRKGAWKYPIEIRGIDPMEVVPGYKYELANDFKSIVKRMDLNSYFQADIQEHRLDVSGSSAPAPTSAPASPSAAPQQQGVPLNGLMASATGVVKSCIEKGMEAPEAAKAGLAWAHLWGDIPPRAEAFLKPEKAPATAPGPDSMPERMSPDEYRQEFDDEIPF